MDSNETKKENQNETKDDFYYSIGLRYTKNINPSSLNLGNLNKVQNTIDNFSNFIVTALQFIPTDETIHTMINVNLDEEIERNNFYISYNTLGNIITELYIFIMRLTYNDQFYKSKGLDMSNPKIYPFLNINFDNKDFINKFIHRVQFCIDKNTFQGSILQKNSQVMDDMLNMLELYFSDIHSPCPDNREFTGLSEVNNFFYNVNRFMRNIRKLNKNNFINCIEFDPTTTLSNTKNNNPFIDDNKAAKEIGLFSIGFLAGMLWTFAIAFNIPK